MGAMIEISVRRFYTSNEADVAPRISVVVPVDILSAADTAPDWEKLADAVANQMKSEMPFTNLREMTPEEVTKFRADEDDE